jgi:hypothetical protein
MTTAQIKEIQRTIGVEADGIWGPISTEACKKYLRGMMPKPHPWPATDETSLRAFYGRACDESLLVNMPAPVPMFYEGRQVKTLRCHVKVAESLGRALTAAYEKAPMVVKIYDGIYNCRNVSGSSSKSLHARGAAIDIWAEKNGSRTHWPKEAWMPLVVMEEFAKEGWLSGGAFWSRDAMHMQSTR